MMRDQLFFFLQDSDTCNNQRWSRGHKARGQGQGHKKYPRPRTALPRIKPLEAKHGNALGHGQGPWTQAQVLSKKKKRLQKTFSDDLQKKAFKICFQAISRKRRLRKVFSGVPQNFNNSKSSAVLEPTRTGQFSRT